MLGALDLPGKDFRCVVPHSRISAGGIGAPIEERHQPTEFETMFFCEQSERFQFLRGALQIDRTVLAEIDLEAGKPRLFREDEFFFDAPVSVETTNADGFFHSLVWFSFLRF